MANTAIQVEARHIQNVTTAPDQKNVPYKETFPASRSLRLPESPMLTAQQKADLMATVGFLGATNAGEPKGAEIGSTVADALGYSRDTGGAVGREVGSKESRDPGHPMGPGLVNWHTRRA